MSLRRRVAACLFAAVGVVGCTLIYDAGDFDTKVGATLEAGADTSVAPVTPDPCEHVVPPGRPAAATAGTPERLVFALSHLGLVAGNADRLGFDLDGVCTCETRPGTVANGASSCIPRKPDQTPCDGPGGRDNGAAALFSRLVPDRPDASVEVGFDLSASEGVETVLVELDEYAGGADDPEVLVAIYDSPGLDPPSPCDAGTVGDAGVNGSGRPRPAWGGCDSWRVSDSTLLAGRPRTFTREAWVRGGQMVAKFDVFTMRLGRSELLLYDAVLTAKLTRGAGSRPQLDEGLIAGRIVAADLLRTFGEQEIGGKPLCGDALTFGAFRAAACNSLDLGSSSDAMAPCDSISFSADFEARLARRGTTAPPPDGGPRCGDLKEQARCP